MNGKNQNISIFEFLVGASPLPNYFYFQLGTRNAVYIYTQVTHDNAEIKKMTAIFTNFRATKL